MSLKYKPSKRRQMYLKFIEIHQFLTENKKNLQVMNHAAASIVGKGIVSSTNVHNYLKRMADLHMIKRNAFMPLRVRDVKSFAPVVKNVAKSINYPQTAYSTVDNHTKSVDNLLITGIKVVDKPVGNFALNVDNFIARIVFDKSYPHPVGNLASYQQLYPQGTKSGL